MLFGVLMDGPIFGGQAELYIGDKCNEASDDNGCWDKAEGGFDFDAEEMSGAKRGVNNIANFKVLDYETFAVAAVYAQ